MQDYLAPLMQLDGVANAANRARDAVALLHRHKANRRGWPTTAAAAAVQAARASAAIDGSTAQIPTDGPVNDPLFAGALRVGQALDAEALTVIVGTWKKAPLQALARLHMLAAADLADSEDLGRPRPSAGISERLDVLAEIVTTKTSAAAPVVAAIVHGELLALNAFGSADGIVARAAGRLVAVASGFDPHNLSVPEVGWLRQLPQYRAAAQGFATGNPAELGKWIVLCCEAYVTGAREATAIADAIG